MKNITFIFFRVINTQNFNCFSFRELNVNEDKEMEFLVSKISKLNLSEYTLVPWNANEVNGEVDMSSALYDVEQFNSFDDSWAENYTIQDVLSLANALQMKPDDFVKWILNYYVVAVPFSVKKVEHLIKVYEVADFWFETNCITLESFFEKLAHTMCAGEMLDITFEPDYSKTYKLHDINNDVYLTYNTETHICRSKQPFID